MWSTTTTTSTLVAWFGASRLTRWWVVPAALVSSGALPRITNGRTACNVITDHLLGEVPALFCVRKRKTETTMLLVQHLLHVFAHQEVVRGGSLVWDIQARPTDSIEVGIKPYFNIMK